MFRIIEARHTFRTLCEIINDYINPNMRVAVIPFSHSEQKMPTISKYDAYCNRDGEYYELIVEQFYKLGIPDSNIDIVHYYNDDINVM